MSLTEFFARDEREEYHNGEVFPIVDVTVSQGTIVMNAGRRFGERLDGKPCLVIASPTVRIHAGVFVLPDIAVICGRPAYATESAKAITNPKLIGEVLSPSTAGYDHGGKFDLYEMLPSLEEYLLISQAAPRIKTLHKASRNSWKLTIYEGLESAVNIASLGIEIPIAEFYAGVEFPPPAPGPRTRSRRRR